MVSLQITGNPQTSGSLTFAALNLPRGLSIDTATGVISGTIDYTAAQYAQGQYASTIFAANSKGGSTSASVGWYVANVVRDPVLTNPGSQTSARGSRISLQAEATQPDGETLLFEATGLPPGLTINDAGLIQGRVAHNAGSTTPYLVTLTVHALDKSASQSFEWSVPNTNLAPTLDDPGEQFGHAGEDVWLPLSADDFNGDPLSYTATGLPAGLSIDPNTGEVEGTIADSAAGTIPHTVTLTVSDGVASTNRTIQWHVSPLRLDGIEGQVSLAGASVSLQVGAHSATAATLTYSATGLPAGLSVDANTGVISGTISWSAVSDIPHEVTVSVSDGTRTESRTTLWRVSRLAMVPPANQSNLTGNGVDVALSAIYHGTASLKWSAIGLPLGSNIDSNTGRITGTLASGAASPHDRPVEVSVSDGVATVSQTFYWDVGRPNNQAPGLGSLSNQSTPVSSTISLQLTANDPEGDAITFDADGLPEGLDYDPETGLITGSPTKVGSGNVTVTALDGFGASSTQWFTWTVSPVPPPWTLTGGFRQGVVVQQYGAVLVSTIRSPDLTFSPWNFTVTVNPGTGMGQAGHQITPLGPGYFGVYMLGAPYSEVGNYTATVTVAGPGSPTPQTATSSIVVGKLVAGKEAQLTVATLPVGYPYGQPNEYTATIQWGDGSSSTGELYLQAGGAVVTGKHTYAIDSFDEPNGRYTVSVTITRAGQTVASASNGVVVTRPPMQMVTGKPLEEESWNVAGQPLAVFTVPSATDPPAEFTAQINWGDGTSSAGTILGGNGLFRVVGSHLYTEPTHGPVEVVVNQSWSAYLPVVAAALSSNRYAFAPAPRPTIPVSRVALSGNGLKAVFATTENSLAARHVTNTRRTPVRRNQGAAISGLATNGNGTVVAAYPASAKQVVVYSVSGETLDENPTATIKQDKAIKGIAVETGGKVAISTEDSLAVYTSTGVLHKTLALTSHADSTPLAVRTSAMTFSPNGEYLATVVTGIEENTGAPRAFVAIWSLATGEHFRELILGSLAVGDQVYSLAWDGATIAVGIVVAQ